MKKKPGIIVDFFKSSMDGWSLCKGLVRRFQIDTHITVFAEYEARETYE